MNIDLRLGDCLEVMKDIPAGSIDAIICDPPYGTTACKWDSVIDFGLMWEQLNRVIKPNGAIVLFGSEPFSSALRMSNIKNYRYDWVWDKVVASGHFNANRMPMKRHEVLSVFYKKLPTYNKQMKKRHPNSHSTGSVENYTKSRGFVDSDLFGEVKDRKEKVKDKIYKCPDSIVEFSKGNGRQKEKVKHPTQKPVALMEYLIKTYTQENETVLDFTMGSGSTGVGCVNTNRNFIGIEMEERYFSIARERIKKALEEKRK